MKLTEEQKEIINCDFNDILLINAFAGTGKTTTLVEFCKNNKNKKILYLSYNRGLKEEAVKKFQNLKNVKVSTYHSLAYKVIGYKYKYRLGNLRPYDIAKFFKNLVVDSQKYYYGFYFLNLLHYFQNSDFTIEEYIEFLEKNISEVLIGYKNYNKKILISEFSKIWNYMLESDYFKVEHDFYLKLFQLGNYNFGYYDYILVDEAQDLNGVMINIILKQKGKKVFIGDNYQQIYSWRGTKNIFDILKNNLNKKELFLTNSFRCYKGNSILANKYLQILGAKKEFKGLNKVKTNFDNYTVISRTNGTLIKYIINNKGKVFYVGGIENYRIKFLLDLYYLDIGDKEKIKDEFIKKFSDILDIKCYADQANEVDLKSMISLLEEIKKGKLDLKELRGVNNIEELVENLYKEATSNYLYNDYSVSTAHKAKGLEWENVILLNDFISLKGEFIDFNNIELEELNIIYVAITRAKQKLRIEDIYDLSEEDVLFFKEKLKNIIDYS